MGCKPNIVLLFSDQHRADTFGAAGHAVIRTPNLDRLAREGICFEHAYCQAPLCVPARVSLLTERYVRDHGAFENCYERLADLPTVVQVIRDAGYRTVAIGKMHLFPHFKDVTDGLPLMHRCGFTEVHEVVGKLASAHVRTPYTDYLLERGLLDAYRNFIRERTPAAPRDGMRAGASGRKPLWTVDPCPLPTEHYQDTWVGRQAATWIESQATDQPFFLWVGFPGPHDPWDAPAEYVERYREAEIELDSTRRPDVPDDGPLRIFLRTFLDYSSSTTLTDERIREVRRHYFANVTLIDEAIGSILRALESRGLDQNTWITYTTDHGEMLGTHGLLNKMVFYDPAVRVPLIVRPPGGCDGRRTAEMVEHLDLAATLRTLAGAGEVAGGAGRPFCDFFAGSAFTGRDAVISENYGFAMWRTRRYKIVIYEKGMLPVQLFDLIEDPGEDRNIVADREYETVVKDLMDAYVRPFLSTRPIRPGPDLVERDGGGGLGSLR